jgi:signal transduction histidine kinase
VVSRYRPTLEQSNQNLIVQIESNLPEIILDPSRLEQVIINLLSNASKFSPPDSDIWLAIKQNKGRLHIEVKDSGIGISAEEQRNLFEPYHRVLQDRNQYPGTGLGLAICKQIVISHGGRIWVQSESGKGSTFAFEIPMKGILSKLTPG